MSAVPGEPWRLFFAIPMPADAAARLGRALQPYASAFPSARWQRPDALHVTVWFLGATPPDDVPRLVDIGRGCVAGVAPFRMSVGAGDGLLRGRGSVAWCAVVEGGGEASSIARCLAEALMGERPARESAPPHLTVARHVDAALISALRGEALGRLDTGWLADRVVLYRSHTGTPAGSAYELLAEVPL